MVFHWSWIDSKSLQVSSTLLSILVDLNEIVVCIVSTRPLISKSPSTFINPSVNVPTTPIGIGKIVTFMCHSFIQLLFYPLRVFLLQRKLVVFHWILTSYSDKSSRVSRTLLRILADLNNGVILMISASSVISNSFSPWTNSLMIVPRTSITIGKNDTLMFHSFFRSLAKSRYLSLILLSLNSTLWSAGTAK